MFCHKCGEQLPEGTTVCHKCGASIDTSTQDATTQSIPEKDANELQKSQQQNQEVDNLSKLLISHTTKTAKGAKGSSIINAEVFIDEIAIGNLKSGETLSHDIMPGRHNVSVKIRNLYDYDIVLNAPTGKQQISLNLYTFLDITVSDALIICNLPHLIEKPSSTSELVIKRNSDGFCKDKLFIIYLDDEKIGSLPDGETFTYNVKPGKHKVTLSTGDEYDGRIGITLKVPISTGKNPKQFQYEMKCGYGGFRYDSLYLQTDVEEMFAGSPSKLVYKKQPQELDNSWISSFKPHFTVLSILRFIGAAFWFIVMILQFREGYIFNGIWNLVVLIPTVFLGITLLPNSAIKHYSNNGNLPSVGYNVKWSGISIIWYLIQIIAFSFTTLIAILILDIIIIIISFTTLGLITTRETEEYNKHKSGNKDNA